MPKPILPTPKSIQQRAKVLRQRMTDEERILWSKLRKYGLQYRFRRQYPIGRYIVDFICLERRLIIELDGSQHFENNHLAYDCNRTVTLENLGFTLIRFSNLEIRQQLHQVLNTISFYLTREI